MGVTPPSVTACCFYSLLLPTAAPRVPRSTAPAGCVCADHLITRDRGGVQASRLTHRPHRPPPAADTTTSPSTLPTLPRSSGWTSIVTTHPLSLLSSTTLPLPATIRSRARTSGRTSAGLQRLRVAGRASDDSGNANDSLGIDDPDLLDIPPPMTYEAWSVDEMECDAE